MLPCYQQADTTPATHREILAVLLTEVIPRACNGGVQQEACKEATMHTHEQDIWQYMWQV